MYNTVPAPDSAQHFRQHFPVPDAAHHLCHQVKYFPTSRFSSTFQTALSRSRCSSPSLPSGTTHLQLQIQVTSSNSTFTIFRY
jgi:hypothetical protein